MKPGALETTFSPEEREKLDRVSNWRERMMNNFRVVVCLNSEEGSWKYQVKNYPCLVTEATIILFENWPLEALATISRNSLKTKHSADKERVIKAVSEVHLKMQVQMDASPAMFTEFLQQFEFMAKSTSKTQREVEFLEMTMKKLEDLESALVELKKALKGNPK